MISDQKYRNHIHQVIRHSIKLSAPNPFDMTEYDQTKQLFADLFLRLKDFDYSK